MIIFVKTTTASFVTTLIEEKENELKVEWPMELISTLSTNNKPLLHFMPLTMFCENHTVKLNKNLILFYDQVDSNISKEYLDVIQQVRAQQANIILSNINESIVNNNNIIDIKKFK